MTVPQIPYTERDIIELMIRAPSVPKWFEPDMVDDKQPVKLPQFTSGVQYDNISPSYDWILWNIRRGKAKITQWPRAYAIMVLEAKV